MQFFIHSCTLPVDLPLKHTALMGPCVCSSSNPPHIHCIPTGLRMRGLGVPVQGSQPPHWEPPTVCRSRRIRQGPFAHNLYSSILQLVACCSLIYRYPPQRLLLPSPNCPTQFPRLKAYLYSYRLVVPRRLLSLSPCRTSPTVFNASTHSQSTHNTHLIGPNGNRRQAQLSAYDDGSPGQRMYRHQHGRTRVPRLSPWLLHSTSTTTTSSPVQQPFPHGSRRLRLGRLHPHIRVDGRLLSTTTKQSILLGAFHPQ